MLYTSRSVSGHCGLEEVHPGVHEGLAIVSCRTEVNKLDLMGCQIEVFVAEPRYRIDHTPGEHGYSTEN